MGQGEDGIAKTPQWASHITGIPADRIIKLAREIGSVKPAYICQGWGPQRQANGEQTARAIAMLPILTGNVGIHGGNSGARESTYTITIERLPVLENPVKTAISCFSWTDAIARGPEMTALRDGIRGKDKLDVPIKFLWNYAGNPLINQHSDINKTHEILQDEAKCEMIVVIDNFMTSSAKYADILLPDLMTVEQEDIIPNDYAGNMGYLIFIQPATTPKFERKPIYWVLSEIARRLGDDVYQRFTEGRTQAQWLQYLYAKMQARDPALPAYDELKKMGIYKRKDPNGHFVAYKKFREDPQANPLKTPSGKIEIYSSQLAHIASTWELAEGDVISPLPIYTPTFEGWDDPKRSTFPLQLFGFHYKSRTHSSYGNIDVLQAACRQEVWINPLDAQKRGIANGDKVRVFNDRGEVRLPAKVTPRILPGVSAMGQGEDGIAKTPQWAAQITSIPAEKIIQLAREIGSAKPAYICQGWGPQRHSNGEQAARAIAMLSVLTGNVGINGGNSGVREGTWDLGVEWFSMLENPVKTQISVFTWTDAIDHGAEMTATRDGVRGKDKLDVPIKFLWCYASNTLINQHGDIAHTHEVLQDDSKCEMIVGIEHFMTASAKYCDILLPDLMPTEQEDLISHESAGNMGYVILGQPATSPKFERKPIYWTLSEVAKRLGPDVYQTFTEGRTQHEWVKYLHAKTKARNPEMPDYEEMKQTGIFKKKCPEEHYVAFRAFREDPAANPLKTPSGKIEIYSERLATLANTWELKKDEIIHPLPAYTPGFDGWDDPLRQRYPLQLTGFHYKARTHSSYGNIDVLQQACPQEIWINPIDAQARGIQHGDTVRVFNQNGEMLIPAKVTPRILPGVTAIGQGAWLNADMFGDKVDRGGSINILTSHRPSPLAKGNPSHSNLVQVEKA